MSFYRHLEENTLTGVKGGTARKTFLEIWMVNVNGRIFARTWNKSKRSWYTAFLEEGIGEIRYGNITMLVSGNKPEPNRELTRAIDQAYLQRYDQPANREYAIGITQPEYHDYTMEFHFQSIISTD